jgi:TonB family protein
VNDIQKGLSISILVHCLVLVAVLSAWLDKPIHSRTISLDFTTLNFERGGDRTGDLSGDRHADQVSAFNKNNKREIANVHQVEAKLRTTGQDVEYSSTSTSASRDATGMPSDNDGQVEVYGKPGFLSGEGEVGTGISSSSMVGQTTTGGGHGGIDGRTIRYGSGSADEKAFHYIRDGVIKNVKYPERARRKGLAGKILLSFTVSESGLTRDVKIINSSGFTELDDSAKEAVTRTKFFQKIPYKLFVILPIEYRLE